MTGALVKGLAAVLVGTALFSTGTKAEATAEDPDWPCVQRLVPTLSMAAVWDGPVSDAHKTWHERQDVRSMVLSIAPRRTAVDKAKKSIAEFAKGLGDEKDTVMSQVFVGLFDTVNHERGELISGIKRYAKRQQRLAAKLRDMTAQLNQLADDGSAEAAARRKRLEERLLWDTRIHDEREKSLRALCEQPVLLEQRLFLLTRAIRKAMDQ